jgi:hypothetical protein
MNLVDSLKKTLSIGASNENGDSPMTFVKSKKGILKELIASRDSGNLIGIYSKVLGDGMFLVGVNNIETDTSAEIIVFETYEQSGMILNRTRVSIDEIKLVCPFAKRYLNPILNKIQVV